MSRKGMDMWSVVMFGILIVLGILVFGGMAGVFESILGKVGGEVFDSSMPNIGSLVCEDIGDVSFEEFMKNLEDMYKDCKDNDVCGTNNCKTMTINLDDGDAECYEVSKSDLACAGYDLSNFIESDDRFNLYCMPNEDNLNTNYVRVDYSNYEGENQCDQAIVEAHNTQWSTYFNVADGAHVTVTAYRDSWPVLGLFINNAALELQISGGEYDEGACVLYP